MASKEIKDKIQKSLESMSEKQLQTAWLILKEIENQKSFGEDDLNRKVLNEKIQKGIQQLDNGEGTGFRQYLNEMQVSYGKEKK